MCPHRELGELSESAADGQPRYRMAAQVLEQAAREVPHVEHRGIRQVVQRLDRALGGRAGAARNVRVAGRNRHVDAAMNGVDPGRAGVGNHHAGGAQNRNPADDSQPRVPGLSRQPLAVGDRNLDDDVGIGPCRGRHLLDHRAHHAPRHRVDGRLADRDRQPRQGRDSHTGSGPEDHPFAGAGAAHLRTDQRPVRHVGIIAGVLDDARKRAVRLEPFGGEGEGGLLSLRQRDADGVRKLARQQRGQRCLGRGGCAGAGGPASTQGRVRFAGHDGL